MNHRLQMQILVVVLLLIGAATYQGISAFTRVTAQNLETRRVTRIVDGDTVHLEGFKDNFRLIGIDTPESSRNARAKSIATRTGRDLELIIAEGKRAKAFTASLLENKSVTIEWDVQRKDRYQRNLAYLIVNGKNSSVEIAKAGYADPLTIPPNVKYAAKILAATREAREANRGLWR
jgi:micrococcal nuclease